MKRERLLARIASWIVRGLFATLRLRYVDHPRLFEAPPDFPVIFTFWHNRILAITLLHQRRYPRHRKGVNILTSPSRDGEILAQLVAILGMGSIRGSSSRRGSRALMECVDWIKSGGDLAISPDGPKGPRYKLSPGVILLAQTTNARILPMHARFSRSVRINSWDGFRIPWPFSRVEITLLPYETVPPTPTPEAFEAERLRIENLMKNETD